MGLSFLTREELVIKLLAVLFMLAAVSVTSVLAMIYGWGLTPQNWAVIVASYIALLGFQVISMALHDK
jgi:hypothetical protein